MSCCKHRGQNPFASYQDPATADPCWNQAPAGFSKSQRLTPCSSALATTCCPLTKWDRR